MQSPIKHLLLLAIFASLAATQVPTILQQPPPPLAGLRGRVWGRPQCHRGLARLGCRPPGRSIWLRLQLRPAGRRLWLLCRCEQRVQGVPHLRAHLQQRGRPGQDGQVQLCVWRGNPVWPVHPHMQLPRCMFHLMLSRHHLLKTLPCFSLPSLARRARACMVLSSLERLRRTTEHSATCKAACTCTTCTCEDYWAYARCKAVQSKVNKSANRAVRKWASGGEGVREGGA